MADLPATPLLDSVATPHDLRTLKPDQLRQLADELRAEVISAVGTKDYPMIQGMVLVYAGMVLAVNLVVDLILITIDPRTTIAEG